MIKQCKKICALLIMSMLLVLSGCGQNGDEAAVVLKEGQSDLEYVKGKGTLVAGVTDYAPLDYRNGEEWIGFDVDLANVFAESIGVKLELKEIDWNEKTELLEEGTIDCIWNGMTLTKELQETISCSQPYLSNAQVLVLQKGDKEQYQTVEACQHLLFAVEEGSTGEALLKEMNYRYSTYPTQREALQSVCDRKADAAVIDIIMASYFTGEGQEFADLDFSISLNDEKIGVGFRKKSDLTKRANEFLQTAYEDGTMRRLADKYNIEEALKQ